MNQDSQIPLNKQTSPGALFNTAVGAIHFLKKNQKPLWISLLGVVVFAAAWMGTTLVKDGQEKDLQAEYYKVEKDLLKKKEAFDKALAEEKSKKEASAKANPKTKNNVKTETPVAALEALALPTGDLEKDYGPQVQELKALALKNPSSRASQLSTLLVSSLYVKYQKPDLAKELLEKSVQSSSTSLLKALTLNQLGTVYSDLKDCSLAIKTWDQVLEQKKFNYLHREVLLRQGVCFESLNDLSNAERKYLEASQKTETAKNSDKDTVDISSLSMNETETLKEAEKKLKALKIRKNFEI